MSRDNDVNQFIEYVKQNTETEYLKSLLLFEKDPEKFEAALVLELQRNGNYAKFFKEVLRHESLKMEERSYWTRIREAANIS